MKPAAGPSRRRTVGLALALACAAPAFAVETSILTSPAPSAGAELAFAVGLDGTVTVLGAPGEDSNTGAIYAVDCSALPCTAPLRIAPNDIVAEDAFGSAVAIAGDTLVATAPGAEAAYVYVRNGAGWDQQARLVATGGGAGERFGVAVSISGDRIAVGADRANADAGAVYVFVRSGTLWTQEARLMADDPFEKDALGSSVSLDGDVLLAGAPFKHAPALGSYANGAAYIFARDAGGWAQAAKLTATGGANADLFGFSVNLAGDRAVIGAPYASSAKGVAYVFTRGATTWSEQAQLASATAADGDQFGWSVAQGDDSIFVGAPFNGQLAEAACGATFVFDASLLGETAGGSVEAPLLNEMVGWSLAASGSRWIASAPGHVVGTEIHAGAAYWFDPLITLFHSGFDASGSCTPAKAPRVELAGL